MNQFDLQALPELMVKVLEKRDQPSLKEFTDKVDLYLIVEESRAGDLFPDSVFEFIFRSMTALWIRLMEKKSDFL